MKNYLAVCSYNGSKFFGFQRQPRLRNVQSVIEDKLSTLLGKKTLIHGAGRTDKGVHALGQTFSFKADIKTDYSHFVYSLNRLLPKDVVVLSLKEVPPSFDARHSNSGKVYRYDFSYGTRDPLQIDTLAQLEKKGFDVDAFCTAIKQFEGKHDFSNFTTKTSDVDGFIRTISSIDIVIDKEKQTGSVTFKGNGFMTYMVRLIMGCSFKAGYHQIDPKEITNLINRKPRHIMSFKAPAEGLYLVEVLYGE